MRETNAERLIDALEIGGMLTALCRRTLNPAKHNIMGRGMIKISKFTDDETGEIIYNYTISDTAWEHGVWVAKGGQRGGTVTREKAIKLLAYYGDYKTVKIY
jgi:hypothetical protein